MTLSVNTPQPYHTQKPKRKIIRKKKPLKEVNKPEKVNQLVSITLDSNKKKKRKIIRKSKNQPIDDNNKTNNVEKSLDSESGSEDDIECVFTISWYHNNSSYLLDENTQEVFSKKNHSLVGMRYINDDELSVIDFDYSNNFN
jgi:hypothetical protein